MRSFHYSVIALASVAGFIALMGSPTVPPAQAAQQATTASAPATGAATQPLKWYVYKDADSKENHGVWSNIMPAEGAGMISLSLVDKTDPKFGETAVRMTVTFKTPNWCGLAVACAPDYWGKEPSVAAWDLRGAKKLVFWAHGDKGTESIQVKTMVTGGERFGDSTTIAPATPWLSLTKGWKQYELSLEGVDASRVVTNFCVVTNKDHNENAAITFYLDEIYVEMGGGK